MAELVILTGISGSGKSTALFAFEEMKYNCVENIPLQLCDAMLDVIEKNTDKVYSKTLLSVNLAMPMNLLFGPKNARRLNSLSPFYTLPKLSY